MSPQNAETIAAWGLLFLSSEQDRLERFMKLSGLSVAALKSSAHDRTTLAGILDYILSDDGLVLGFAEFAEIDPELPAAARRTLAPEHFE